MNKTKLAFDQLSAEMEVLTISELFSMKGGDGPQDGDLWTVQGYTFIYDSASGTWQGSLPEVSITTSSSDPLSWNWINTYTGHYGYFAYSSSGYNGNMGGGGSTGGGSTGDGTSTYSVADIAAHAISTSLAFNEFYNTLDAARLGNLSVEAKDIVHNLFQNNPGSSLISDIRAVGKLDGIALLSATGKVLGFTQAAVSLATLYDDIANDDGTVSMTNVADAVISVGSLFVKSNILGATVSLGWLIIKGGIDDN